MVSIKVKGGTPVSGTPVCYSCEWSHVTKGYRDSEEIVRCRHVYPHFLVTFPVQECTGYSDRMMDTKADMEKIAWILLSDRTHRKAGFVRTEEFRRLFRDDEEITP